MYHLRNKNNEFSVLIADVAATSVPHQLIEMPLVIMWGILGFNTYVFCYYILNRIDIDSNVLKRESKEICIAKFGDNF